MTAGPRTYTRSELAAMPQQQLAAQADEIQAAAAEGRIFDDGPPAPLGDGPIFTRSQLAAMPYDEVNRRRPEILQALQDNRFVHNE